jgi:hypothetical protein
MAPPQTKPVTPDLIRGPFRYRTAWPRGAERIARLRHGCEATEWIAGARPFGPLPGHDERAAATARQKGMAAAKTRDGAYSSLPLMASAARARMRSSSEAVAHQTSALKQRSGSALNKRSSSAAIAHYKERARAGWGVFRSTWCRRRGPSPHKARFSRRPRPATARANARRPPHQGEVGKFVEAELPNQCLVMAGHDDRGSGRRALTARAGDCRRAAADSRCPTPRSRYAAAAAE